MSLFHPSRGRIDGYLAAGLSAGAERRLRRHLSGCERCRGYYDQGVRLLRASRRVAGEPGAGEAQRILHRAFGDADTPPLAPSRWALLAFAGLAVAAGLLFIVVRALPAGPPAGRVASMSGEVYLGSEPVAPGAGLRADIPLEVRKGELVIALQGGRTALLRDGARVRLSEKGDVVTLEQGRGRFSVTPGQGPFTVISGTTLVSVKGTIFAVDRKANDETLVAVHQGLVEVSADQGSVRLSDGQETTVRGGRPSVARPASAESLVEDRGGGDLIKKLRKEGTRLLKDFEKAVGD